MTTTPLEIALLRLHWHRLDADPSAPQREVSEAIQRLLEAETLWFESMWPEWKRTQDKPVKKGTWRSGPP
ncbi:MAG: hypothetical protein RBU30_17720 [Polyangia bacterium]|jgi:hypothetical protein|nr:hypothetical protein [Polyangia bacterium]